MPLARDLEEPLTELFTIDCAASGGRTGPFL
jgi:hypothetical protein